MSVRAWIVRRKIKSLFRTDLTGIPEAEVISFKQALLISEKNIPQPPKTTEIEAIDEMHGDQRVRGEWVSEPGADPNRIIFYCHGGGYVWGAPKFYRELAWRLSKACDARVFLLDYSLAPAAKFPIQVNEGLAAYDMVCKNNSNARVVLSGDSAGGNLAVSMTIAIRDNGGPAPAALALISPWLDMTGSGDSLKYNGEKDVMLQPDVAVKGARAYSGELAADDPRCSPLFADHKGLPPILTQVGSEEILLDDSTRLAASIDKVGGDITLKVWPKMHHAWHMSAAIVPEARKAIKEIADYFEQRWTEQ